MATRNLHEKPFNEDTKTKLEIFEKYAEAWLPTFVMQARFDTICIFDFFAGTGFDNDGIAGSPIRILRTINRQLGNIFNKRVKVRVYLNEFEPDEKQQSKFQSLKNSCDEFVRSYKEFTRATECGLVEICYYNENSETLFPKLIGIISQYPSLVYLDQNGIKFLSNKYLLALAETRLTDFLYFVSSSYIVRFGDSPEFKNHLNMDVETIKKDPYKFIHRNVIDHLRKQIPVQSKVKLYPYSIKKGTNIYGIIFGASHIRAVDKFLALVWDKSPLNGEANFDIDDDLGKNQLDLFTSGNKRLNKIEVFSKEIRDNILNGRICNNVEAYTFTMNNGHIPKHAKEEINKMRKAGLIHFKGHPKISYDAWNDKDVVPYEITKQ